MIKTGIDITKIERVKKICEEFENRFYNRIFTENEKAYIEKKCSVKKLKVDNEVMYNTVAGLFAGKEAISKALGYGIASGVNFQNMEILHDENGAPFVNLSGSALEKFNNMGLKEICISIAHDGGYAISICNMI